MGEIKAPVIKPVWRRWEIPLLILLVLAITLPFIGQAVHIDAQLFIDWAKQGISHPLWQHLPNYDYFGVHYDEFHDTHPRLQSLYLSLWLRLTSEVSEPFLHLAMIPFPIMAVVAMYFLARRFRANAFIASLLFITAPAFLVNTHLIMTDVPGIAFWLLAILFFIQGVDRNRLLYLGLAAVFFTLCIFDYYQGLSALPLAFLYLLLSKKVNAKTVIPIAVPSILFLAFVSAHFARYGQPPTFSYPFGLPLDPHSVIVRIRGTATLLGGAMLFPLAALVIFARSRFISYGAFGALIVAAIWSTILYLTSSRFAADGLLLLPWLLAAGMALFLFIVRKLAIAVPIAIKGRNGKDDIFLCVWLLGVLFYCSILLPYPSPRYMIPLIPPFAIFTSREIVRLWGAHRRQLIVSTSAIVVSTLLLAMGVAIGEHQRANNNRLEAEWIVEHYPAENGRVWFNGGLGFQYYVQQNGYSMVLESGEGLQNGDYIVESVHNNRWYFDEQTVSRLDLVEQVDFPRRWPVMTEFYDYRTSWLGQIGMVIPYGFSGDYEDRLYIYKVVREPQADGDTQD